MIINSNIENAIDMHAVPNPLRYFDLFSHPLKPEVLAHKAWHGLLNQERSSSCHNEEA